MLVINFTNILLYNLKLLTTCIIYFILKYFLLRLKLFYFLCLYSISRESVNNPNIIIISAFLFSVFLFEDVKLLCMHQLQILQFLIKFEFQLFSAFPFILQLSHHSLSASNENEYSLLLVAVNCATNLSLQSTNCKFTSSSSCFSLFILWHLHRELRTAFHSHFICLCYFAHCATVAKAELRCLALALAGLISAAADGSQ